MARLKAFIERFASNTSGATAIEYAFLGVVIILVLVPVAYAVGAALMPHYERIAALLT